MSELKPCPFCGSEDVYNVYLPDPYSRDQYAWVNCKTCNASGGQFVQRVCPDDKSFSRNEMELESTKLWNTRPIEDELRARIAELEAESDQLTARLCQERQDDKWIPVSERLPEANKCVLIYDAGGNMTVDILVKSGGVETYFWLPKYRILFWMPLPEPPVNQLTAHNDTERQDDKSPNNTQTQTIVYGKESEE